MYTNTAMPHINKRKVAKLIAIKESRVLAPVPAL